MGCKKQGGASRRTPGLHLRAGIWHIDKVIRGNRVCESTGTGDFDEAQELLAKRIDEIRQARLFGTRPPRTFRQAATKYLQEAVKKTLDNDAYQLRMLDPFIGDLRLDRIHMGVLQEFIEARRIQGVSSSTINHGLQTVRHICNLAAGEWIDEHGLTWLEHAPKIKFLPVKDRRQPYPLGWDEQKHLLQQLPGHLARMVLFAANSGCREAEVCALRWDWELEVAEMNTSVFIIPARFVKNEEDRLVVLNDVARSIIDGQRGQHPERVFVYRDRSVAAMNNSAWKKGRIVAALSMIRESSDCGGIEESVERVEKDVIATVWGVKRGKRVESIYTWGEYAKERAAKGKPVDRLQYKDYDVPQQMLAKARQRFIDDHWPTYAAFSRVRVHDLKHTFGRRLRAAGVGFEDRQDLLGHTSERVTTHYSATELGNLIDAANRVCGSKSRKSPALVVLKRKTG